MIIRTLSSKWGTGSDLSFLSIIFCKQQAAGHPEGNVPSLATVIDFAAPSPSNSQNPLVFLMRVIAGRERINFEQIALAFVSNFGIIVK